jgi:hypothetical protein
MELEPCAAGESDAVYWKLSDIPNPRLRSILREKAEAERAPFHACFRLKKIHFISLST